MEALESRVTPTASTTLDFIDRPQPTAFLFNGSDAGVAAVVNSYYSNNNQQAFQASVMGSGFTGGVRVAMGDIDHNGMPDMVVAAGPGGGPRVQVLSGSTGDSLTGTIGSFYAYDSAFTGGVQIAIADVNQDGYDDVICGPGAGGGPQIKVFSGYDASVLASFYAFDSSFTGGVTLATADYNGDGLADLVVAPGIGGGPNVKIFDLSNLSSIAPISGSLGSFWAFDSSFTGGVSLGTDRASPDLTGDGIPDILVAQGPGTGSLVRVIDGSTGGVAAEFSPLGTVTTGLRVATAFVDNDSIPDIVVGKVSGVSTNPKVYSGVNFVQNTSLSIGTVTPLGNITGKGGSSTGSSIVAGTNISATGSFTVGGTVDVAVQVTGTDYDTPTGYVNLAVNYPDAALTYNYAVALTGGSGLTANGTIPVTVAAGGSMIITGTYGGDPIYKYDVILPYSPTPPSGSGTVPLPSPIPGTDPIGSTSPRIKQTVLPIKFGDINPAGYDGYWMLANNDLPGGGLLGLNRTWSSKPNLASGAAGTGSTIADMPRLKMGTGTLVQLIVNSAKAYEFDSISAGYSPRFRQPFKLYSQTGNELVVATDSGRVFTFFDFSTGVPDSKKGTFKSMLDEGGNLTSVQSWDSSGHPTEVTTVNVTASPAVTESIVYTYLTSTSNSGMLSGATLRRKVGSGSFSTVMTAAYTYHDGTSTTNGLVQDLKTVEVKNTNNETIDYQYYRYYTNGLTTGYAHALKYALGFESYKRIVNDLGDPDTKTDSQIGPYADHYFEYVSGGNGRISKHVMAGYGNSETGGGLGAYTYSYVTNSGSAQGFNIWKTAMTETNPDGAVTTTYSNAAGQLMLSSFKESSSSTLEWAKYNHYDAYGAIDLQADPTAVDTSSLNGKYKNTWGDLVNFNAAGVASALKTGEGLITVYNYGTDSSASTTTAGSASGYLSYVSIKRGQSSSLVHKIKGYEYYNHTGNNVNTYVLASTLDYPSEAVAGIPNQASVKTSYTYDSWYSYTSGGSPVESAQAKSITVKLPIVSAGQNGADGSTGASMTSIYDIYGRTIWVKDAGGYLAYTQYDAATMSPIKSIVDVNVSLTSDFSNLPSSWTTPSGGGLHLKSTAEVDAYGRIIKTIDPNGNVSYKVYKDATQEVRIYSGWTASDSTHGATTGPMVLIRRDLAHGYSETLTYSTTAVVADSKPTGAETVSGVTSLARSYTNLAGQTTAVDSYFDLSGLTYSTASNLGTEGTNYLRMRYAYDDGGRQNRSQTPSGTITRIVYDKLGRPISTWTGLDDTPTTGTWIPSSPIQAGTDLVKTAEAKYDQDASGNSGVGNSNLTSITEYPGGGAANRTTQIWYDWRNRVSAVKGGVESSEGSSVNRTMVFYLYDNWDDVTSVKTYDADGAPPTLNAAGSWYPGTTPPPLTSSSSFAYDNLGQLYQTIDYKVDPSSGTASTKLTTNYWYDARGNMIKSSAPGGLVTKAVYDGVGRLSTSYLSDGGGDSAYSDASSVTGDTVFQQAEMVYDSNSNPIMVTTRDRFHNASGTGALTTSTSRDNYTTAYYDALNRVTSTIDAGTNGTSPFSRASTVPTGSDTLLRTDYGYNTGNGMLETVTDPRGIQSKSFYDAMGRTTKTVEAYDGGSITATTNKTTELGYDSYGHLSTVKAYRSSSDYSQTQYIYGVTTSGSAINNNDILSSIRYPDKSSGNASSGITDSFTVNALGEVTTATDRLGTTHTYSRDVLGRLTADTITTLGSGLDGTIRRIETAYDPQGNAYLSTSYDAVTGGAVKNQVQDKFNGFGQLINEYQAHDGTVNTSSTLNVGYSYVEGGTTSSPQNNSRQTGMVYPNGRTLTYDYGTSGGTNDKISRLEAVKDGSTTLESYQYLGLNQAVIRSHPQISVDLTYVKQGTESNGDAGDQYTGLDRFGRIVDQRWVNTSNSSTPEDRFQYGYDRDGNVLYKNNVTLPLRSELYHADGSSAGYDNLNQLTAFARGTLSTSLDSMTTTTQSQSFTPDGQGNFTTVTNNGTGVTRTYDKQNELTAVGSTSLTYDAAGNIKTDEQNRTYTYDGWNRLISVSGAGTPTTQQVTYTYDALGHRIKEVAGSQTRELYYSAAWQVIEERVTNGATPPVMVPQVQYVWSPVYVDAMIERDRDNDADGSLNERLYVLTDANFNVTALVGSGGGVIERYQYDPFGKVTILTPTMMPEGWTGAWEGWGTTSTSYYGWQYFHQGGRQDTATGLLNFRNRDYSTSLMRWTTNDPIGFGGGDTNTYRYVGNGPGNWLDPIGLAATKSNTVVEEGGDLPAPDHNGVRVDLPTLDQRRLDWRNPEWWTTIGGELKDYGYDTFVAPVVRTGEFSLDVIMCWDTNYKIKNPYLDAYLKGKAGYFETVYNITSETVGTVLTIQGAVSKIGGLIPKGKPSVSAGNVSSKGATPPPAKPAPSGPKSTEPSCGPGSGACFIRGTLVITSFGPIPIDQIKKDDKVMAYDLTSGKWALTPVVSTFQTDYRGFKATIRCGSESIESTASHPFWVIGGEDLDSRPWPEEKPELPEMVAITGRWIDAASLRAGDRLLLVNGQEIEVEEVVTEPYADRVFNLEVADVHTYAVGRNGILVHNSQGITCPPKTLTPAQQLAANGAQGAAFEQQVLQDIQQIQQNVVQQVTVKTKSGVKTRLDFLGKEKGTGAVVITEAKSSATAGLTPKQTAAFPEIAKSGATVVGMGKPGFPGGTTIPPTTVDIIRPK